MLDARLDLPHASGLTLTDEWLDLSVDLGWSQAAGLWCFPIETVSQSEGGIEGVYQSSAVIPHWHVTADEHGRWEVQSAHQPRSGAATPPVVDTRAAGSSPQSSVGETERSLRPFPPPSRDFTNTFTRSTSDSHRGGPQ